MRKRNEDCFDCDSCMSGKRCSEWKKELGVVTMGPVCSSNGFRYYANKEECNRLLKLWDDANGSISEWRENDRPMLEWDHDDNGCFSCIDGETGVDFAKCKACGKSHKYFADKTQTEALLKWHDDRYGTIQDRLEKEDDVKDLDLRVDDQVTIVEFSECKIASTNSSMFPGYPIAVQIEPGNMRYFRKDGTQEESAAKIIHRHGAVTVEENMPVRMITVYEFIMKNIKTGELKIVMENEKIPGIPAGHAGWEVVYGPSEFKIPE